MTTMRLLLFTVALLSLRVSGEKENKDVITLDIERFPEGGNEKGVGDKSSPLTPSKRSPQGVGSPSVYGGGQQYILANQGQPQQQIPGEYYNLLQLQGQGVTSQQVHPNDIQQVLVSRTPYQFTAGQYQQPPLRRLTPEQEQQRRLQEAVLQKPIREQEARDAQRQQLRQYYQQLGLPAGSYQLQPQLQAPQSQLSQQTLLQTPLPSQVPFSYYQPAPTPQPSRPVVSYYQPEPDQVSYSQQVQYGGGRQGLRGSKSQDSGYQREQAQPQQSSFLYSLPTESSKTVQSAAPQQYLIETTKPEDGRVQEGVVAAHRPVVYYQRPSSPTPSPDYSGSQQEQSRVVYIGGGSSPGRVGSVGGHQRPLTDTELNSLINAGFQVRGGTHQTSYEGSGVLQRPAPASIAYYNGIGKRQSRRGPPFLVPRPVPLSKEEREAFAQQGIRNLYTVESTVAESRDVPVTYVLALGKPKTSNDS